MMASGVWAEQIPVDHAHSMKEVDGNATVKSELERIGYLGNTPASHKSTPMGAHFELHIEQGPILERASQKIGVVQGVQAYKWFTIDIQGRGKSQSCIIWSSMLLTCFRCTHRIDSVDRQGRCAPSSLSMYHSRPSSCHKAQSPCHDRNPASDPWKHQHDPRPRQFHHGHPSSSRQHSRRGRKADEA